MKVKHILLCCISLVGLSATSLAQEKSSSTDSISQTEKYGIRVGVDLAKPIRTLLEDGYSGLEIMGDFRVT